MSRKTAREAAFKTIFEIPFHSNEEPIDVINFSVDYSKSSLKQPSDVEYFKEVTLKCYDNLGAIDEKIAQNLKEWKIDRISKVNLSILRLAICEMMYFKDIPYQVSINEAVEIAKKFGDDDSPSFINGVLASAV